jgi:ribosomal protein S18 acetylase RimI-like enzyme
MTGTTIRAAVASDAEAVVTLASEFHEYLRSLGDTFPFRFTADDYRRDGFGDRRAFEGLVAEARGQVIGYLLFHDGYDTDDARRLLHVVDLYVRPDHRRGGVGKSLMVAAGLAAASRGATDLVWTVFPANADAAAFYERLGARRSSTYLMAISANRLRNPGAGV